MRCANCKTPLVRKRFNGRLEDRGAFRRRRFCDRVCMSAWMEGRIKMPSDRNGRRQAAKTVKGACPHCGRHATRLSVHHVDQDPRNNAAGNLRTLCGSCHRRSHSPNYDPITLQRRPCSHCSRPAAQRGWCFVHLSRFRRYGDPLAKKFKIGSKWVLKRCTT